MEVLNKVKNLKTADTKTFLSWEFNTLKDSKRDVTKLKNAIRKSGWSFPVIVWNNFVIDGAGRKKAVEEMIKEGDTIPEIPYVEIEAENLQDAKSKALEVSSQFGEITKESFLAFTEDIEIDFDTFEIDGMSADAFIESDEKDDEVPETPTEPKSKLGDLYELGEHRVLCGDSTKIEDVERLMDGKKADMVFTDPPYGIAFEDTKGNVIKNDDLNDEKLAEFNALWQKSADIASKGDCFLLAWQSPRKFHLLDYFGQWKFFRLITMYKSNRISYPHGAWINKTEPCCVFQKGEPRITKQEYMDDCYVYNHDKESHEDSNVGHPTPKPVKMVMSNIKACAKKDDIILDLFLGSGSTLIAAEKTGRICYGMELDPKYIDVIVQRYVDYVDSPKVIKNGIDETHLWKKKTK